MGDCLFLFSCLVLFYFVLFCFFLGTILVLVIYHLAPKSPYPSSKKRGDAANETSEGTQICETESATTVAGSAKAITDRRGLTTGTR